MDRYLRRSLFSSASGPSRCAPVPSSICPPIFSLTRSGTTTLALRYRGIIPQSGLQRNSGLARRKPRNSGTVVLCLTCSQMDVMVADRRWMTTISEGKYKFGYFIGGNDDRKILMFSPYIAVGTSGDANDAEAHIRKLQSLSSPATSLEELYRLNKDILDGKECQLGRHFKILFLDCRKVLHKILKLQFGKSFLKQDFYYRFQVAAIGSGADQAMKIAYPMEHLFPEPYFSDLKDLCIQRSMLNAFVNKASCGGGCDIISWDPISHSWKWEQIDTSTLTRYQSDFVHQTEIPYAITVEEAVKIISEAADDIRRGDIPQELESFLIGETNDEESDYEDINTYDDITEKAEVDAEKDNVDKTKTTLSERLPTDADQTAADFSLSGIDIRVGQITEIQNHPGLNLMYVCEIDVGEESTRTAIVDIVKFIQPVDIWKSQKVCVVCNLRPATDKEIETQAVILAAWSDDHTKVQLVEPPASAVVGEPVMFSDGVLWELVNTDGDCKGVALSTSAGVG